MASMFFAFVFTKTETPQVKRAKKRQGRFNGDYIGNRVEWGKGDFFCHECTNVFDSCIRGISNF